MKQNIQLGHGSGGRLTHDLIRDLFFRYFNNKHLRQKGDSALLPALSQPAFTTDSYVVDPLFFPGGNIGKLAVCGTVNDLAVAGARPLYLSAGFIIEEGLPFDQLEEIVRTMALEAEKAGVQIVTGDTKVVNKGHCDKVFINTAGVGQIEHSLGNINSGELIRPGDAILINGHIGDHGITIMGKREALRFDAHIESDCASLNQITHELTEKTNIRFMRDATRGGLGTVLAEIAEENKLGISINENQIPVKDNVKGLCELLGFDPLYVANEGKLVAIVPGEEAGKALSVIQKYPEGQHAAIIGEVSTEHPGKVIMQTAIGGKRFVDMLAGEQLPRIC